MNRICTCQMGNFIAGMGAPDGQSGHRTAHSRRTSNKDLTANMEMERIILDKLYNSNGAGPEHINRRNCLISETSFSTSTKTKKVGIFGTTITTTKLNKVTKTSSVKHMNK